MAVYTERYIVASIHDFKTNISKYIRMLERGDYAAVEVQRYNTMVGLFLTPNSQTLFEERQRARAEALLCEGENPDKRAEKSGLSPKC